MTGIEFLTRMRDFGENAPPIGAFVGFRLDEITCGRITVSGVPSGDHYNPFGVVHGGFASTLIDLALGHVSISILESMDFMVSTTDLNVKYVRPMFASTGRVECSAVVIYHGRRTVVSEAQIRDESGRLYATGNSTCLILERPGPSPS